MAEESDSIFREVDEDVRRDQMLALWRRHGVSFVSATVVVLLAAIGWQIWTDMRESSLNDLSDRYAAAQDAAAGETPEAAASLYAQLAKDLDGGYGLLAGLRQGATLLEDGDAAAAAAAYDRVVAKAGDSRVKAFAGYLAASAKVKAGDADGAIAQLQGLALPSEPLYYSATELLAAIYTAQGDIEEARSRFDALVEDPAAPAALVARARDMLALFDAESPGADADNSVGETESGSAAQ
ncbi:hypothetical protein JCM17845_17150 [Iodidimonas gelatinilytica]|uniref:Ancillary SecYEG translocon subunit n=1 Tax=Iodidimonas gelatinilytica TaxID=1236966 RepID=A0A5A7MYL8_9PROT|nr:tetratricopeptide repeat protein [Iodidimonas gelatinilytica]GER01092.1 hypothetical protein JCM17845_17150 [Iodidimonas gelatinilytica]